MMHRRAFLALSPAWPAARRVPVGPATVAGHAIAAPARPAAPDVPWTFADAGRVVLWAAGLTFGGALALLLCRILLAIGFLLGEGVGIMPSGTFARLSALLAPYQIALTTLVLGLLLYGSVAYSVYRFSVRKYRLSWTALDCCYTNWRAYARIAALFIPITCGGVLVTRLETLVLGAGLHTGQAAVLTRGMPARPLNFLMLFLLLTVVTPIVEELVFRGFLYRLLRAHLPVWAAAAVSAAAFALAHGTPVLVPWLFFLGVVFALVVERTRSLYSSMLLHAMTNGLATLAIVVALAGW